MASNVDATTEKVADQIPAEEVDALAARAARGDVRAFAAIYELFVHDLYVFARGQARNDVVAEDIVADAFLKAWQSARSYRIGSGRYRQWLFAIVRNQTRDYWRTAQRSVPLLDFDVAIDGRLGIELESSDDHVRLVRALSRVSAEQREIVVLRYFNNKSHAEIGELLGKKEGTVRSLLLRTLRRLRKAMDDAEA